MIAFQLTEILLLGGIPRVRDASKKIKNADAAA